MINYELMLVFGTWCLQQFPILQHSAMVWAHIRLADALPPAWQQKNDQVQGMIVSMPQHTERGTCWLFKVEKVLTKAEVGRHYKYGNIFNWRLL